MRMFVLLLYFFFWSLYCLLFFDLRFLITHFGIFRIFLNEVQNYSSCVLYLLFTMWQWLKFYASLSQCESDLSFMPLFHNVTVTQVLCLSFAMWQWLKFYASLSQSDSELSFMPLFHNVTVTKSTRKTKKYHTVGTVPKSNRKTKNTTLSEQFQNLTEK